MIRILIFIILLTAAAAGFTVLLAVPGNVHVEFGEYDYFQKASPVLIALGFGLLFLICFVLALSYFMRLPGKLAQRRRESQRQKGILSLTRGLEAVAAGDATDAQRHAKIAQKQLEEPALTRLLTAQAAQLAGDHETAEASFAAMLEAPETEFLGLRGLYLQAVAAGDMKAAKGYADRAFKLRPNARWAYDAAYQLSVERGAWSDAQSTLKLASKNGLEEGDHVKRREAALITARAYSAETSGEKTEALKDAEAAVKLAPDFPPAAVLAARLEAGKGNRGKAAKTLETAWAARPHPAIRQAYLDVYKDLPQAERMQKLSQLAAKLPDAPQSRQIEAEVAISRGDFAGAKTILEGLLTGRPTGRTFSLMAAAMRGLHGEAAAEPWLERAADAPTELGPGSDGQFHFTTDGWRRLVQEFGEYHRLAPPPLDEVSAALSYEEVKLLAAPPPAPEPEPAPETEPEEPATSEPPVASIPVPPADEPAAGEEEARPPNAAKQPAPADEKLSEDKERELKEAEKALSAAGLGGGMLEDDER